MKAIRPVRPANLDPIADDMLSLLRLAPEARNIVIGGGVALNCYLEPRFTHDVDAWWSQDAGGVARASTLEVIRQIAGEVGANRGLGLKERPRAMNEVISVELQTGSKTVFSFQVAPRDIELEPPVIAESPFAPVAIETLSDNLGAKMTALVGRGAPRDFQDVFNVVRAEVASPTELWSLFVAKNPGNDVSIAKAQVLKRLAEIELRRPLDTLGPDFRSEAATLRTWVRTHLAEGSLVVASEEDAEPES